MRLSFAPLAALALAAPAVAAERPRAAVEAAMAASAAGWNAGDVDRFLKVYSDAPQTSFVTKTGIVRGKAAMRALYLQHFAFGDAAKRGTLSFATLDFRLFDPTHALLIARYTLTYSDGKKRSGPTSLIFARESTGWHIVADHSS